MADELSVNITLSYTKNGVAHRLQLVDLVDVSGNAAIRNVRTVATTDETLALGDVATIGYVYLHNLDATNYCDFGSDGSSYPLRLKPGEHAVVRWNAAALHAKAHTSTTKIESWIIEA